MKSADVAIIGGGPAGSVAAMCLADASKRVVLLDPTQSLRPRIGESLPGAARPLLRQLRLLHCLDDNVHVPAFGNLSAWGDASLHEVDFILDRNGPGWHLDRKHFDSQLRLEARARGVCLIPNRMVTLPSRHGERWHLDVGVYRMSVQWIVDATGRQANVATRLGARRVEDERLFSLYQWQTNCANQSDSRTLVEATAKGWWYASLLPDKSTVLAFHTDRETVKRALDTPGFWEQQLAATKFVSKRVHGGRRVGELTCTAAGGGRLDPCVGAHWIATGDAAMTFDPLSSQGIYNALYTGMRSGQAVAQALDGSPKALLSYQKRLMEIRKAYLIHRRQMYGLETRWCDEMFWRKQSRDWEIPGDTVARVPGIC